MSTRLVSFLGLGRPDSEPPHYSDATYELDGRRAAKTPLLQRALLELVPEIDSLVILGTAEVRERWFVTGLFEKLIGRTAHFVLLPHGESPEERWEIFTNTVDSLRAGPIVEAGERDGPDQLVVDITHGYRSQPLFGMAALHHVISEWARQETQEPPAVRITYGAFDAKAGESAVSPIWDLTEFVLSSQWNAALDALMRFGRADDIERLGELEMRAHKARLRAAGKSGRELGEARFPETLGKAARKLADDLALNRLPHLLVRSSSGGAGSAACLLRLIESDDAARFQRRLPPVRESMNQLRVWLEPLQAPNVLGAEGLAAMAPLARLYGRLQRFAEQAALVREGLVTHYALATGRDDVAEPDVEGCNVSRLGVEEDWKAAGARFRTSRDEVLPPAVEENLRLSSSMVEPRNDIEHCGLKYRPNPARSLRRLLDRSTTAFASLVESTLDDTGERARSVQPHYGENLDPKFLNLSNHPLADWSAEQLEAARDLDLGEPVDLRGGMPLVRPEADTGEIRAMAAEIADRAVEQGAAGTLVMTEYTLTQALVSNLQRRGVRCFAVTSKRTIVDERRVDDTTEKKSLFSFVRWREYASGDGDEMS